MGTREENIITEIEKDLMAQRRDGRPKMLGRLGRKWGFLTRTAPGLFIRPDTSVDQEALRNFRQRMIFVPDLPSASMSVGTFKKASRTKRSKDLFHEFLDLLKIYEIAEKHALFQKYGVLRLLKKYPCNPVGNPCVLSYKGHVLTERWLTRLWYLALFRAFLVQRLTSDFCLLDIGSSYGVFSYLVKKECPRCTQILVDFPEQLTLAHYYLGLSFPRARIAGYRDVQAARRINKKFVRQFDFVLLPWFFYHKVERGAIDVVSSIASLGEMPRKWFDYYLNSEPFLSTKYFFCMNQLISGPLYGSDLTILDYPLAHFRKQHFRVSQYSSFQGPGSVEEDPGNLVSRFFEFIGERF